MSLSTRIRTWLSKDRGQSALTEILLSASLASLLAALVAISNDRSISAVLPWIILGIITGVAAFVVSLMLTDNELLKGFSFFVLVVQLIVCGLLLSGRIPLDSRDISTPTLVLDTGPTEAPSTIPTPVPTTGPSNTPTPITQPTPSSTPTVVDEATTTPTHTATTLALKPTPPPSATPTPQLYGAVELVAPVNDHTFESEELVSLEWKPVDGLQPGDHYLVYLKHGGDCKQEQRVGENWEVIDATSWKAQDFGFRDCQPVDGRYVWRVTVCRGAALGKYDKNPCMMEVSPKGEERFFYWKLPPEPRPTVLVTPRSASIPAASP